MTALALVQEARRRFHGSLLRSLITLDAGGAPSIADKKNLASVRIAKGVVARLGKAAQTDRLAAQTAGNAFEEICASFLEATFLKLDHLRPGEWSVVKMKQGDEAGITRYEQYRHLSSIAAARKANPELAAVLGSDYIIAPDVVVIRQPETDEKINRQAPIVDASSALLTSLRKANQALPSIHASISCKLTLRSDRAQNARSEALNLIRNRKGRAPHIAVLTAEPLPSRISSLALGTGDIDCVYHFALPELEKAVSDAGSRDHRETLQIMVKGGRLRDIAGLPLDLAI